MSLSLFNNATIGEGEINLGSICSGMVFGGENKHSGGPERVEMFNNAVVASGVSVCVSGLDGSGAGISVHVGRAPEENDLAHTKSGKDVIATPAENCCVVCQLNVSHLAPAECGHLCLCYGCARALIVRGGAKCPICRVPLRKRMNEIYAT